jgi:hypothetical protein
MKCGAALHGEKLKCTGIEKPQNAIVKSTINGIRKLSVASGVSAECEWGLWQNSPWTMTWASRLKDREAKIEDYMPNIS